MDKTSEPESSQETLEDRTSPPVQHHPRQKALFALIGFAVFATITFVISDILSDNTKDDTSQITPTNTPSNTPIPTPIDAITWTKLNILKDEMLFDGNPYPETITSLEEETLIGFDCNESYTYQYDPPVYVYEGANQTIVTLDDPLLINFVTSYNNKNTDAISGLQRCKLETNKTLLLLDIASGGGGMNSQVRVGYLENNQLVPDVAIKNEGKILAPYFELNRLLAVSKDNHAYLLVRGGDSLFGRVAIIKVDLSNSTASPEPIYVCTLQPVDPDPNSMSPEMATTCD